MKRFTGLVLMTLLGVAMLPGCGSKKDHADTNSPSTQESANLPNGGPQKNDGATTGQPNAPQPTPGGEKTIYTRAQFKDLVAGKTTEDVRRLLGNPDDTSDDKPSQDEYWYYHERTKNPEDNRVDEFAKISFHKGIYQRVLFSGPMNP